MTSKCGKNKTVVYIQKSGPELKLNRLKEIKYMNIDCLITKRLSLELFSDMVSSSSVDDTRNGLLYSVSALTA